ncbi:Tetratricopeptide repeat (TPR)-like superfamily protein isoform 1 [Tripterygium wilfordii]|uniref:Tetratricopeptide repeat (TPR)-like superfamily protein isoform 1 n=1 Tax=Tripterygium wilfordii TaxID=458696 RepID=A0A7J7DZE1_TRIWF|nr:outer envelope protein 61-like [Tripterygium wilfordii]KAF5751673.1 Tetratricopeptide repeat (TPR)-like superfamily protein isoform 1 [Tripterygium wilfordii]
MFNGMMDPEMIRLAQEQMSRMSSDELARIQQQMMSNPELMRMASESMKNMRPEDLKNAAEQLKYARPEEMAEIGEKMASASPEEIAAMRTRVDAQMAYEINGAEMLKKQGNELHNQGRFKEASNKYLLAKRNLKGLPSSKSRALLLACSLNLMSCYLKTRQYNECIKEGSEVLAYDAKNVKALYRKGQAYRELGQLEDAVLDLSKAHEVSPDDETISEVLRDVEKRLAKEGRRQARKGLVIEEITEDVEAASSVNQESSREAQVQESTDFSKSERGDSNGGLTTNSDHFQVVRNDPEAIRSFQNFVSGSDPETLAAFGGDKAGDISPEMFKTASNMIGKMSPEELQKMLQMASSFQGQNSYPTGGPSRPGLVPPEITPDMLKAASDMMSKMPSEELQKMYEMASSLKGKDAFSTPVASDSNGLSSDTGLRSSEAQENFVANRNDAGETSSSHTSFSNRRSAPEPSFPASTFDLQEQMRNQMKDPAMRQMFTSMMKNMSPDTMASMSEQFGMKLSREDAAKAQQAMSSLSPEHLDKMMCWMERIQRGVEGTRKAKNWLFGRPGMILAICMLILAIILHRLGFIGN